MCQNEIFWIGKWHIPLSPSLGKSVHSRLFVTQIKQNNQKNWSKFKESLKIYRKKWNKNHMIKNLHCFKS